MFHSGDSIQTATESDHDDLRSHRCGKERLGVGVGERKGCCTWRIASPGRNNTVGGGDSEAFRNEFVDRYRIVFQVVRSYALAACTVCLKTSDEKFEQNGNYAIYSSKSFKISPFV